MLSILEAHGMEARLGWSAKGILLEEQSIEDSDRGWMAVGIMGFWGCAISRVSGILRIIFLFRRL